MGCIAKVFFKRLGSRHIHKEIEFQEDINGIDHIICKRDLNPIRRLIYKGYTFNDEHFGARFKSAYVIFIL